MYGLVFISPVFSRWGCSPTKVRLLYGLKHGAVLKNITFLTFFGKRATTSGTYEISTSSRTTFNDPRCRTTIHNDFYIAQNGTLTFIVVLRPLISRRSKSNNGYFLTPLCLYKIIPHCGIAYLSQVFLRCQQVNEVVKIIFFGRLHEKHFENFSIINSKRVL